MSRNRKPSFRITEDSCDITTRKSITDKNNRKRKSHKTCDIKENQPRQIGAKNKTHTQDVTNKMNEEDSKSTSGLHHILKDRNTSNENHCVKKKKRVKFDEKNIKQTKPDLENNKIECEELSSDIAGKKIEFVVRKLKCRPSTLNVEDTVVETGDNTITSVSKEVCTNGKETVVKNKQVPMRTRKNRATKFITKTEVAKTHGKDLKEISPEDCDSRNNAGKENTKTSNKFKKLVKKTKNKLSKSPNAKATKTKSVSEERINYDTYNTLTNTKEICTINSKYSSHISTRNSFSLATQDAVQNEENFQQCEEALNDNPQTAIININKNSSSKEDLKLSVLGEENVSDNFGKSKNSTVKKKVIDTKQVYESSLQDNPNTETKNIGCSEAPENIEISETLPKKIEDTETNSCISPDSQKVNTNVVLSEPKDGYVEMCNAISESVLLKSTNNEVIDMKKTLNDTFDFKNSCETINTDETADIPNNKNAKETVPNDDINIDLQYENKKYCQETPPFSLLTNTKDCKNNLNADGSFPEDTVLPSVDNREYYGDKHSSNTSEVKPSDTNAITQPENEDELKYQTEKDGQHIGEDTVSSLVDTHCTIPNPEIKKSSSNECCKSLEKPTACLFSDGLNTIKSENINHDGGELNYVPSPMLNLGNLDGVSTEVNEVLTEHIKQETSSTDVNEVLYVCEECHFETKIVNDFSHHYGLSHGQRHRQKLQNNEFCVQVNKQRGMVNGDVLALYLDKQASAESGDASNTMTIQRSLKTRERKSRRLLVYDDSSGEELKMYQCGLCDFKTRYGKNLEVHYRLTHGLLLELYECSHPECHFVTFLKDSLFHHYRTQHVEVGVLVRTLQAPKGDK